MILVCMEGSLFFGLKLILMNAIDSFSRDFYWDGNLPDDL